MLQLTLLLISCCLTRCCLLFYLLVQEEVGVGLLMTRVADNTELCGNATLLIILLHNLSLVLTGRFTKLMRHMEGVQQHHNFTVQMSDSALTGKEMSIYRKRGQGEKKGDTETERERETQREKERNKGGGEEWGRERRGKGFQSTTQWKIYLLNFVGHNNVLKLKSCTTGWRI